MTPGARVAAAIEILDQINAGSAAEKALTTWSRSSRFAGSKDRAAVRDHVFDVLRARRSLGCGSGRDLMIRLLARDGAPLDPLFNGERHAPAALTDQETSALAQPEPLSEAAAHDLPEWLWPLWQDSLGPQAKPAALAQQARADVFLRVNLRRASVAGAMRSLAEDEIIAQPHATVTGCLRVIQNARRVKNSDAFAEGLVELQDASSQFAITAVPVPEGAKVLDYCAGGGGKALAFADLYDAQVFAHDIAPKRMVDLPARSARAGVQIKQLTTAQLPSAAPYDVVFCDAPCSGSGTWRRTPDAKWRLDQTRLSQLQDMQAEVLKAAAPLVRDTGVLAYATCSVLHAENDATVDRFLADHSEWCISERHQRVPGFDGDGFYLCLMARR